MGSSDRAKPVQRAGFLLSLALGRLLRSAGYATTRIVVEEGELRVRKRRRVYAPLLAFLGAPLMRVLDTGVRILPQRDWQARERAIQGSLRGDSPRAEPDGSLLMPVLSGVTLATLLEDTFVEAHTRARAIELAVVALADFHRRGFTHGDAMAENVMVDLEAGVAHWFDFETAHDTGRPLLWRRADDVRALLSTCLLRTAPEDLAETLTLILASYGHPAVTALVASRFAPLVQRPLAFHLGQAPLPFSRFEAVARLLTTHRGDCPPRAGHGDGDDDHSRAGRP